MLRKHGVVGKFVEFYGPGLPNLPLADRATIGNMSPEMGATCAIFPVDAETLRYLEFSGPPAGAHRAGRGVLPRAGPLPRRGQQEATYSDTLELDLGDVEPSLAGPEAAAGPRGALGRRLGLPRRARRSSLADESHDGLRRSRGRVVPGERPAHAAPAAACRPKPSAPPPRRPRHRGRRAPMMASATARS